MYMFIYCVPKMCQSFAFTDGISTASKLAQPCLQVHIVQQEVDMRGKTILSRRADATAAHRKGTWSGLGWGPRSFLEEVNSKLRPQWWDRAGKGEGQSGPGRSMHQDGVVCVLDLDHVEDFGLWSTMRGVVGWIMDSKDIQVLIPGTCQCHLIWWQGLCRCD